MFVTKPRAYLIAGTETYSDIANFVDDEGMNWRRRIPDNHADILSEFVGLHYDGSSDSSESRVAGTFDHASATFVFADVSQSLVWALSSHEARLSCSPAKPREGEPVRFFVPLFMKEDEAEKWKKTMRRSLELYETTKKQLREPFRDEKLDFDRNEIVESIMQACLAPAIVTSVVVTGTISAWRQFATSPIDAATHPEIASLAKLVTPMLKRSAPKAFSHVPGPEGEVS